MRRSATVRVPVIFGCVATAAGLLVLGLVATPYVAGSVHPATNLSATVDPGPPPLLQPRPVAFTEPAAFHSWALLNTRTGAISGSGNITETNDTVSMIKAWL